MPVNPAVALPIAKYLSTANFLSRFAVGDDGLAVAYRPVVLVDCAWRQCLTRPAQDAPCSSVGGIHRHVAEWGQTDTPQPARSEVFAESCSATIRLLQESGEAGGLRLPRIFLIVPICKEVCLVA